MPAPIPEQMESIDLLRKLIAKHEKRSPLARWLLGRSTLEELRHCEYRLVMAATLSACDEPRRKDATPAFVLAGDARRTPAALLPPRRAPKALSGAVAKALRRKGAAAMCEQALSAAYAAGPNLARR